MLGRLRHSLAIAPSRFARPLSTTPRYSSRGPFVNETADSDDPLEWEIPVPAGQLASTSAPTAFASLITFERPSNGLSYAGLPDNKIFLDIPPAQDPLLQFLTSSLQHDGRRHSAERRASRVLLHLHTLTRSEPLPLLREAIRRVMPSVRITRHRHSTKDILIPVALNERQQVHKAVKWLLKASETRGGRTVEERLAREIVLVLNESSGAVKPKESRGALKEKETLHGMAIINRGNIPAGRKAL